MKTDDPAAQAAFYVFTAVGTIALVAAIGVIVLPIALLVLVGWGITKYINRPPPQISLIDLYTSALQQLKPLPDKDAFVNLFGLDFFKKHIDDAPAYPICDELLTTAATLYNAESFGHLPPPPPYPDEVDRARYKEQTFAMLRKSEGFSEFSKVIQKSFENFISKLPAISRVHLIHELENTKPPAFSVPLHDVLSDKSIITELALPYYEERAKSLGMFQGVRDQLDRNLHALSGVRFTAETRNTGNLVMPPDFRGTFAEAVIAYLSDTPFENIFSAQVPFVIPDNVRFEHTHIIGGSGHGKTQLLQHLILNDLNKDDPPSLIVIDSQGEMLRKIQQLSLFNSRLTDRLIIIDPEQYSPALNMFDTTNSRAATYSTLHREQLEAGVIELYNYVFAAIAAEMTSRQSTAFAFVARLMLAVPNATIHTLRELMEDPAPTIEQSRFRDAIERLDSTSRSYFQNQFFTKRYSDLKQQIARRLYGVLSVPAFDRMFSAERNKLDMFDAMQSGKIVLINTSRSLLKSDASALFGRYMIALVMRAVYERIAHADRHPAFLFVDEASEYFDDNIQALLEQARKFNVGLVLAHQHLDQLSSGLRSAIAANTAIKLAGGVNDRDARALAPDMRTSAEFIGSMKKHRNSTEFACYVRNYTANAVRLAIPFGTLEQTPKMTESEHNAVIDRNRERFGANAQSPHSNAPSSDELRPNPTSSKEQPATEPAPAETPAAGPTASLETPSATSSSSDDWRS